MAKPATFVFKKMNVSDEEKNHLLTSKVCKETRITYLFKNIYLPHIQFHPCWLKDAKCLFIWLTFLCVKTETGFPAIMTDTAMEKNGMTSAFHVLEFLVAWKIEAHIT